MLPARRGERRLLPAFPAPGVGHRHRPVQRDYGAPDLPRFQAHQRLAAGGSRGAAGTAHRKTGEGPGAGAESPGPGNREPRALLQAGHPQPDRHSPLPHRLHLQGGADAVRQAGLCREGGTAGQPGSRKVRHPRPEVPGRPPGGQHDPGCGHPQDPVYPQVLLQGLPGHGLQQDDVRH